MLLAAMPIRTSSFRSALPGPRCATSTPPLQGLLSVEAGGAGDPSGAGAARTPDRGPEDDWQADGHEAQRTRISRLGDTCQRAPLRHALESYAVRRK